VLATYREAFSCVIGISDHYNGIAMAPIAYVLGARVIEKHFTLNHAAKGTDHAFSLEPIGLKKMVRDLHRAKEAMGDGFKKPYKSEQKPLYKMGKKLVAAHDLAAGDLLNPEDVAIKSPNDGTPPYMLDQMLGKRIAHNFVRDQDIHFNDLEVDAI